MTRSDMIESLGTCFDQLTRRDIEQAVVTVFDLLCESLVEGRRVEIRGFGSFSVIHRRPRIGRNPCSGATVHVPEKRALRFKAGKALRNAFLSKTA